MLSVTHSNLLKEIDGRNDGRNVGIIPTLKKLKEHRCELHLSNYFIEGEYKAGTRTYKEYLITKKGCELIGNKQQGEKGIAFSILYVERFNEMEEAIANLNKPSYMIDDEIERAKRWIEERQQVRLLEEEKMELAETVQLQAPKVEAWEKLMNSKDFVDFAKLSKAFNIPNLGRNKFMGLLREKKILRPNNEPYQSYVDSKYFEVIFINNEYASTKTLVTPKGIEWLMKKLKEWNYLV